jgi:hypothetical protein
VNAERLADLQASTGQIAAADRIATALFVGFELCDDAGHRLNQIQRIELVKAAILVFDDFRGELESQLRLGAILGSSGQNGRDAA